MNPADRLIVALDVPPEDAVSLVRRLLLVDVRYFKIRSSMFWQRGGLDLVCSIVESGSGVMLDVKEYDTADSVRYDMPIAAKLGVAMVTVHADCVEHAAGFGPKVLAVSRLTDGTGPKRPVGFPMAALPDGDGIVCSVDVAGYIRPLTKKLIVCPGIRPVGVEINNHKRPATPREAIDAGADHIIVGRPIYAADDPVAAARAIIDEIEAAGAQQPG